MEITIDTGASGHFSFRIEGLPQTPQQHALFTAALQLVARTAGPAPEEPKDLRVVLVLHAGTTKLSVIKTIREVTHLGLSEAKTAAESLPWSWAFETAAKAAAAAKMLRDAGAKVELLP